MKPTVFCLKCGSNEFVWIEQERTKQRKPIYFLRCCRCGKVKKKQFKKPVELCCGDIDE